jgi:serine protease Do
LTGFDRAKPVECSLISGRGQSAARGIKSDNRDGAEISEPARGRGVQAQRKTSQEVFVSMKLKALPVFAALAIVSASAFARAQQAAPPAPAAPALAADAQTPTTPPAPAQAPLPPEGFATTFFQDGPYLGVRAEEITRENMSRYHLAGEPRGVGVREVVKGSPAERAGLREGDVILRFDGEAVTSVRKLTRLIEESAADHAAHLTVSRDGAEQELTATLAARSFDFKMSDGELLRGFNSEEARRLAEQLKGNAQQWRLQGDEARKRLEELQREHPGVLAFGAARRIGVTTSTLGKQLADYFGVSRGVLVSSVEANSPAEKAGLKAGDVITEADGQAIGDAGELVRALSAEGKDEVTLTVVRERKQRTVRVRPEKRAAPQGLFISPEAFSVEAPIAATVIPRVVVPEALVAPRVTVTPRALALPRVLVAPPRVRVLGFDDRIL